MSLKVPKRAAERPNQQRNFPEGQWVVEIEEVRSKEPPEFMLEVRGNKARVGGAPAELLGVQLGKAIALNDGQEDAGNQKLFADLIVMDSGRSIQDLDFNATSGLGWGIQRDAALYVNLALALGQAYEADGGVSASDDFLDRLRNGDFNGHKVIVDVKHNAWKSKDGSKSGTNVDIQAFSPAA